MPDAPPKPKSDKKWLALVLLASAQFVVVLDASIVNVALPSIGRDLDFAQENLAWVVNAYTLVFGGFLLLGGRMADLLGRRRLFIGGLVLFGTASMVGGFSQSEGQLIAARAARASAPRSSPRPPCRSSPRSSPRAPSATRRSGCGAP